MPPGSSSKNPNLSKPILGEERSPSPYRTKAGSSGKNSRPLSPNIKRPTPCKVPSAKCEERTEKLLAVLSEDSVRKLLRSAARIHEDVLKLVEGEAQSFAKRDLTYFQHSSKQVIRSVEKPERWTASETQQHLLRPFRDLVMEARQCADVGFPEVAFLGLVAVTLATHEISQVPGLEAEQAKEIHRTLFPEICDALLTIGRLLTPGVRGELVKEVKCIVDWYKRQDVDGWEPLHRYFASP